jgi:peptidoglycan-N-acetylglucosamine deacetylase
MKRFLFPVLIAVLFQARSFPETPAGPVAPPPKPDFESGHAAPALTPVKPEIIFHGPDSRRYIALTFDACLGKKQTGFDRRIISTLLKTRTPATFFLGGKWMLAHPKETLYLSRIPYFELGNHSYAHLNLTKLSDRQILDEMKKTQDIMYRITEKQGVFFRAPYGKFNDLALRKGGELGLRFIHWNVTPADPDPKMTGERITRMVLSRVKNGSIIIMHVNGRGVHTYEALPNIIAGLRMKGFEFVTVSKLLAAEEIVKPVK